MGYLTKNNNIIEQLEPGLYAYVNREGKLLRRATEYEWKKACTTAVIENTTPVEVGLLTNTIEKTKNYKFPADRLSWEGEKKLWEEHKKGRSSTETLEELGIDAKLHIVWKVFQTDHYKREVGQRHKAYKIITNPKQHPS